MDFIIASIAVYVITSVFVYSGGVWGSLEHIRETPWMKRFGLLDCFLCTSFWFAAIVGLGYGSIRIFVVSWGVAYIIDQLITAYKTK